MNRRVRKDCECTCEYVLPDYMGDIKKILMSKAKSIPAASFVGEGEVEIGGCVEYEILYADSDNKLTAITASADYGAKVPVSSDRFISLGEEASVESFGIRITGPRKIIMKSTVASVMTINEDADVSVSGDGYEDGDELSAKEETVFVEDGIFGTSGEREYAEEAERLEGLGADEVEIISTSGSVRITEAESYDGGVSVKGEIIIVSIVRTPEQPPFAIRRVIPFEERVEIEGVSSDMQAVVDGYVTSAVASVNRDGEDAVVVANAIAEYNVSAYKNSELTVVTDAYLHSYETDEEYRDMDYPTLLESRIYETCVGTKEKRESVGCDEIREILFASSEIKSTETMLGGNSAKVSGEIEVCGVACEVNVDGSVNYVPIRYKFPFETDVNFSCQIPDGGRLDVRLVPTDTEIKLDGDDIYVSCSIGVRYHLVADKKIRRLGALLRKEELTHIPTLSRICVYYPTPEDDLFSVAKRFHTTERKIAEDNRLSETVFSEGTGALKELKKLIIK